MCLVIFNGCYKGEYEVDISAGRVKLLALVSRSTERREVLAHITRAEGGAGR